jgi:hypothetical protein
MDGNRLRCRHNAPERKSCTTRYKPKSPNPMPVSTSKRAANNKAEVVSPMRQFKKSSSHSFVVHSS